MKFMDMHFGKCRDQEFVTRACQTFAQTKVLLMNAYRQEKDRHIIDCLIAEYNVCAQIFNVPSLMYESIPDILRIYEKSVI